MTYRCHSLETIMISSCVRFDVRISAAAHRVGDKHAVLFDPFIRNTENLSLYSPVVSSEILNPQRFRRIVHPIDDSEMGPASILVHPYPPLPDPHCKCMATPKRTNPRRSFAFGSVISVPAAITPPITPTIEINHMIMRSPPPNQQVGLPPRLPNAKIKCIFRTVANPLELIRNRSAVPRWERQNCKGNTTLSNTTFIRER